MKQLSLFGTPQTQQKTMTAAIRWKLYVDGAARNNPGPAGAGICLMKNDQTVLRRGYFLGKKTNNQAEYLALIFGLLLLRERAESTDAIDIVSDSLLLVRQLQGEYRVKHPELQPLHAAIKKLLTDLHVFIQH